MATRVIADWCALGGVSQNGLTVSAYKASRITGIPALGTAPPGGGADATAVSGTAFGGPGAWQIVAPTVEDYYCTALIGGQQTWQFYPAASATAGVATVAAIDASIIIAGTANNPTVGVGQVPLAKVTNAAALTGGNAFTGAQTFAGLITANAGLTAVAPITLPAASITDAMLVTNPALKANIAGPQTFTGTQTFSGSLVIGGGPLIDIRSKGALVDGATDDSAALTTAVTALAATGGTVLMPPGLYGAGAYGFTGTVGKPVTVLAWGARILPSIAKPVGMSINTGNTNTAAGLRIYGLWVDGQSLTQAITNVTYVGTTVTAFVASSANLAVGQAVVVSGVGGTLTFATPGVGVNGAFEITAVAAGQFSYLVPVAPTGAFTVAGTLGTISGFLINNSDRIRLQDCRVDNAAGVAYHHTATGAGGFQEMAAIENCFSSNCGAGAYVNAGAGANGSFGENYWKDFGVTMAALSQVGFKVSSVSGVSANLYRSTLESVIVWLGADSHIGYWLNGDITQLRGHIAAESITGAGIGLYIANAASFTSGTTADLEYVCTGTFNAASQPGGVNTLSVSNPGAKPLLLKEGSHRFRSYSWNQGPVYHLGGEVNPRAQVELNAPGSTGGGISFGPGGASITDQIFFRDVDGTSATASNAWAAAKGFKVYHNGGVLTNIEANPRVVLDASQIGVLLGPGGATAPDVSILRDGTGHLSFNKHLSSTLAGAPVTSTLGANVTSVTFTGNDLRGKIAIVMAGALAANTKIATCTFNATYGGTSPVILLVNQTSGAGLGIVNFYVLAQSTGVSFDLACNQALAAGTYTIGYVVIG